MNIFSEKSTEDKFLVALDAPSEIAQLIEKLRFKIVFSRVMLLLAFVMIVLSYFKQEYHFIFSVGNTMAIVWAVAAAINIYYCSNKILIARVYEKIKNQMK